MAFRSTPDFRTHEKAEAAWTDAWALVDSGQPQIAIAIFERLHNAGHLGAASALGFIWNQWGDVTKALRWYRLAVDAEHDVNAKVMLAGVLVCNAMAENLPPDHEDVLEALRLIEDARQLLPYAGVLAGFYCRHQNERNDSSRNWQVEEQRHFEAAHEAGLVVGSVELARVLWRQGHFFRSIALRLNTAGRAISLYFRNRHDPRLFGFQESYDPFPRKKSKPSAMPVDGPGVVSISRLRSDRLQSNDPTSPST